MSCRKTIIACLLIIGLGSILACSGGSSSSDGAGAAPASSDKSPTDLVPATPPAQEPDGAAVPIPANIRPFLGKWIETHPRALGGRLVLEFHADGKGGYFIDISMRNANGIDEVLVSGQFKLGSDTELDFDFPATEQQKSQFVFAGNKLTLDPGTANEDEYISFADADLSMNNGVILGQILVQNPDGTSGAGTLASVAAPAPAAAGFFSPMPFVPGDIVVKYRDGQATSTKALKMLRNKFQAIIADPQRGSGGDHLLRVRPQPSSSKSLKKMTSLALLALGYRDYIQELKEFTLNVIDEMNQRPDVERAMPNFIFQLATTTIPAEYSPDRFWNMGAVNATAGWTWQNVWSGAGSFADKLTHVEVAVIDSGKAPSHSDLDATWLSDGYDFVPNLFTNVPSEIAAIPDHTNDLDFDATAGYDNDPTDPGAAQYNQYMLDVNGQWARCPSTLYHGTHVAGIIGAARDNGGVVGVAPGVKILPIRVAGRCGMVDLVSMKMGFEFAIGNPVDMGGSTVRRDHPVDIINASFRIRKSMLELIANTAGEARRICGSAPGHVDACVAALREPIDHATAKGVVVVAAAGNDAEPYCRGGSFNGGNMVIDPSYPASFDNVISVAAFDANMRSTCYSNFGKIDFSAPGGYGATITSSVGPGPNDTAGLIGTSQACPHIAGTVALLKAANRNLFPANFTRVADTDFYKLMKQATSLKDAPIPNPGVGYGHVDIGVALQCAVKDPGCNAGAGHDQVEVADAPPPAIQNGRPVLGVSPSSVYLGYYGLIASVYLSNRTGMGTIIYGAVTIKSKTGDKNWITVSNPSRDQGPAAISIAVDRTGLDAGRYAATLELAYSVSPPIPADATKKVEITVTMDVHTAAANATPVPTPNLTDDLKRRIQVYVDRINQQDGVGAVSNDFGTMMIMLQDPIRCPDITSDQCKGLITTSTDLASRYVFGFPAVPPGNYIMWAGSDDNGDGKIGGPGEFFGRYPATTDGAALIITSGQIKEGVNISVSH